MDNLMDDSLAKALNGRSLSEPDIVGSVQIGALCSFQLEQSLVNTFIRAGIAAVRSALKRRTLDAISNELLSRDDLRGTRVEKCMEFAISFKAEPSPRPASFHLVLTASSTALSMGRRWPCEGVLTQSAQEIDEVTLGVNGYVYVVHGGLLVAPGKENVWGNSLYSNTRSSPY
jgi:hypothetical protein